MDDLVALAVMIGAIFFCSKKCEIVSDWSRVPNLWLVLDGVEDSLMGSLNGVKFCSVQKAQRQLGGREIHRLQARFLTASMVGCSGEKGSGPGAGH